MASAELLRQSPLFARFDDATLERIAQRFSELDVPANQLLIEPRMAGAGLFVICDGTVVVEAHDLHRELGPGEVIGEISLLEEGTRRARVTAKTDVHCLALARADFEQLLAEEPELETAMRELAQTRLTELDLGA